jgi:hypothetical protein
MRFGRPGPSGYDADLRRHNEVPRRAVGRGDSGSASASLVHKSVHTTVSCFDGCCIGQLSESARRRDVQDRSSAAPQAAIRAFGQPSPDLSVRRSRVTGVDDSDETGRSRPVRRREDQDQQMWPTRRTRPAPSPRSAEPSPRFPECRGPPDPSWVGYHSGLLGVLRCR